jgi:membrane-bound lytic murein transglycosylase B
VWHHYVMLTRRLVLATPVLALPFAADAQARFDSFITGVRAEARRGGVSDAILDEAFEGVQPSAKVLELDHHQPEFTMTWAQFKAKILPPSRFENARTAYREERTLLTTVPRSYGCDGSVVLGIWGLESAFGTRTGNFRIVEALATLAFDGRRAAFFRVELLNALRILQDRDIAARAMTGSWAGAMGQPQFMPSAYLHYAVDADGDGKRNIWTDRADVFGSVANYLAKCGWRVGEPWGQRIEVPDHFTAGLAGRDATKTLAQWQALGVRREDGKPFSRGDVTGAVVMPDGIGGEAYMTYANFKVIRRYNPSDYYALSVGLVSNAVA